MARFAQDLMAIQNAYLDRIEEMIANLPPFDERKRLSELSSALSSAKPILKKAEICAMYAPDSLPLQNQTLGIVQQAESEFNASRHQPELAPQVHQFVRLAKRFSDVVE